ncbi:hypothetical protein BKA62DRAFT_507573 [Auriculariales sp. MPI-PUGE-AT-0066]|nr:hypothetical protein BKA62DRAFT_507573 [Auriculariales sp. MPI-PUGE-AT-0066]
MSLAVVASPSTISAPLASTHTEQQMLTSDQLSACLAQPIDQLPLKTLALMARSAGPLALNQSTAHESVVTRIRSLFSDEVRPGIYQDHDTTALRQIISLRISHTGRALAYAQLQTQDANEQILEALLDRFTPILFTFPATRHMACTDAVAHHWDDKVLQPALANNGAGLVAPLETLERIKALPWISFGVCQPCLDGLRIDWTSSQRELWDVMGRAAEQAFGFE